MIGYPYKGQSVMIWYAKKRAHLWPLHGRWGTVKVFNTKGGPKNVLVVLDDGQEVIVPKGNILPDVMELHSYDFDVETGLGA